MQKEKKGGKKKAPGLSEYGNHKGQLGGMGGKKKKVCPRTYVYVGGTTVSFVKRRDENKAMGVKLSWWCVISAEWVEWLYLLLKKACVCVCEYMHKAQHQTPDRLTDKSRGHWASGLLLLLLLLLLLHRSRTQHLLLSRRHILLAFHPLVCEQMTYLLAMFGYKPSKTTSLCEVIMQIWWILLRIDVKFMIDFGPGQTKKKKKKRRYNLSNGN